MSNNLIPQPMSHAELADLLEQMARLVRAHDSWEGNIEYVMPMGTGNDADVLVRGVFRTGNLNGQGGVAMIGRVPAVTEEERS